MRDGRRDGPSRSDTPSRCPVCAAPLASARARYCSAVCRQRAHRLRHRAAAAVDPAALRRTLQHQRRLLAHTVYACPSCETRLVGARRCPDCQLFCRQLGLGGHCPDCDTPILLSELLDLEVPPERHPPAPVADYRSTAQTNTKEVTRERSRPRVAAAPTPSPTA